MNKEAFEIAAQFGGKDCSEVILPHFRAIKKALKKHRDSRYCDSIDEFSFLLRVDGQITQWEFYGCENIDFNLKERFISIDVGVPILIWKKSNKDIADYFSKSILEGADKMVEYLLEKNISIEKKALRNDLISALEGYVKEMN